MIWVLVFLHMLISMFFWCLGWASLKSKSLISAVVAAICILLIIIGPTPARVATFLGLEFDSSQVLIVSILTFAGSILGAVMLNKLGFTKWLVHKLDK
jgi:hypothetical protein